MEVVLKRVSDGKLTTATKYINTEKVVSPDASGFTTLITNSIWLDENSEKISDSSFIEKFEYGDIGEIIGNKTVGHWEIISRTDLP